MSCAVQAHFHTISADPPIGTLSGSSSSGRLAGHEIVGGDTCEESCAEQRNDDNPKFQFLPGALSGEEIKGIQSFADENLGLDESSVYFMRRRKAIAFVFVLLGRVYSLEQNYFVQNESYNDFSGGMQRRPHSHSITLEVEHLDLGVGRERLDHRLDRLIRVLRDDPFQLQDGEVGAVVSYVVEQGLCALCSNYTRKIAGRQKPGLSRGLKGWQRAALTGPGAKMRGASPRLPLPKFSSAFFKSKPFRVDDFRGRPNFCFPPLELMF